MSVYWRNFTDTPEWDQIYSIDKEITPFTQDNVTVPLDQMQLKILKFLSSIEIVICHHSFMFTVI